MKTIISALMIIIGIDMILGIAPIIIPGNMLKIPEVNIHATNINL